MLSKDKKNNEISKYPPKQITTLNRANFTSLNVERLKGALSYFSYLYTKGELSYKAFETLVRYACSIYIENEVEERIKKAIEYKLMQVLESKLSSLVDEDISDIEPVIYGLDISRLLRSR